MADLIITQEPGGSQKCALTKEQMVYKLTYSGEAQMFGMKHKRTWTINSAGVTGESFDINSGALLHFTGTDTHQIGVSEMGDSYKIKSWEPGQSIAEWIDENLLPVLNSSPVLTTAYRFTRSANRLVCWALGYNTDSIDYTANDVGTMNMTTYADEPGTYVPIMQRVRLEARISVLSSLVSGEYVHSPWLGYEMEVGDTDAKFEHDFGPAINDMINELDKGQSNVSYMKPSKSVRKGYVQFRAIPELEGAEIVYTRSATLNLLKGGRKKNEQYTSYLTNYVGSGATAPLKWLSGRRGELWTSVEAWDYLSFHARWENTMSFPITVNRTIYYTNGNVFGDTLYTLDETDVEQHQIVTIPAGFNQLNLDAESSDKPYKYVIEVSVNNVVKLKQVYRLLPSTDTGATLIYNNEFGLPEGIWLEGVRIIDTKHDRETLELAQPISTLKDWINSESYGRSLKPMMAVNTRALAKADTETLWGVLLSKNYWIRRQGDSRDYPVQLLPDTIQYSEANWDGDNVRAMNFKLQLNTEY